MAEVRIDRLICEQTQDTIGDDEAFLAVFVDGDYAGNVFRRLSSGETLNLGFSLEFETEIRFQLWEVDNPALGNPHDFLGEVAIMPAGSATSGQFNRAGGRYRLEWTASIGAPSLTARRNQASMTANERSRFLAAVQAVIANGSYGQLVVNHAGPNLDFVFRNHFFAARTGARRFLSWHRAYLRKFEEALQAVDPGVFLPYWRWTVDRGIPDWLAGFMPDVPLPVALGANPNPLLISRSPATWPLPTTAQVANELSPDDYGEFSSRLERGSHGNVHVWVGGTMSDAAIASADILFWLHHAEIDRLWHVWQGSNDGVPDLTGNEAIMDPWTDTVADLLNVEDVGYVYV